MGEGTRIPIHARPGSARETIAWDPWRRSWVVRVREAPEGGQANEAILRALARWLDVPPDGVLWLRAGKGPSKLALVDGLRPDEVERRLRVAALSSEGPGD